MGQAFDRDGHVLGEAFGDTKREVFDKLSEQFKDAAEIRIRSLSAGLPENDDRSAAPPRNDPPSTEMPRYRCHKEVWALKISSIFHDVDLARNEKRETDGSATLVPVEVGYAPFKVGAEYLRKHNPQVGGYYVVYQDGYKSFSPAAAFEEGYTRV